MDKRKAVFRQIIDSAVFDGEELEIAPNLSTLTGTGVKVASPRGFVIKPRGRVNQRPQNKKSQTRPKTGSAEWFRKLDFRRSISGDDQYRRFLTPIVAGMARRHSKCG